MAGAALALALFVTSCAAANAVKRPSVAVDDVSLQSISLGGATVRVLLDLRNPNPFALPIEGVDWTLDLAGAKALDGQSDLDERIPANGSAPVAMTVTIGAAEAAGAIAKLLEGARAYQLNGNVKVATPLGPLGVPFSRAGTLQAP
jgi:LEA14-like dessication related protein